MHLAMESLPISLWDVADRPREKLHLKGSTSLTDSELLAILLGSGSRSLSAVELAKQLLLHHENKLATLHAASVEELKRFKGIGSAKAVRVHAALELGRRAWVGSAESKVKVTGSDAAYQVLRPMIGHLDHEQFCVLYLSQANEVIRAEPHSKGGWTGTVADVRPIYRRALELKATALIVSHNHPSGQLRPSDADTKLTQKLKQAGEFMDIKLLDHLIVTQAGYFSFADQGQL